MSKKKLAISQAMEEFESLKNKAKSLRDIIYLDGVLAVLEGFKEKECQNIIEAKNDKLYPIETGGQQYLNENFEL